MSEGFIANYGNFAIEEGSKGKVIIHCERSELSENPMRNTYQISMTEDELIEINRLKGKKLYFVRLHLTDSEDDIIGLNVHSFSSWKKGKGEIIINKREFVKEERDTNWIYQ